MAEDMIAVQAAEQEADLVALVDGRARTYGLMARLPNRYVTQRLP